LHPHSTSWRSISKFSYHLRLGLPSGTFPPGHPLYATLLFPIRATCLALLLFFIWSPECLVSTHPSITFCPLFLAGNTLAHHHFTYRTHLSRKATQLSNTQTSIFAPYKQD
jgi:hypothetical protein